jgi:tetratricopeptide (TPR) repeat protein
MSRPWPTEKPRRTFPAPAIILIAVAGGCSLVLIAGVVLTLIRPPRADQARTDAGDALFAEGDIAGAITAWREELEAGPSAELWSRIGIGEIARREIDCARDAFEQALAMDPQRVDALVNLARIDADKDLEGSIRRLNQAEELEPNRLGVRLVRAQVLLDAGDIEGARTAFVDELNINPSSPRAWMGLRECDRLLKEDVAP